MDIQMSHTDWQETRYLYPIVLVVQLQMIVVAADDYDDDDGALLGLCSGSGRFFGTTSRLGILIE